MTRFLSESFQAPEPFFRLALQRLEALSGHPNADIRFSSEVMQRTQAKVRQLGLDERDTTAKELYHALQQRIKADDVHLTRTLRTRAATHVSAEADVVAGMVHVLRELSGAQQGYALKATSLRRLFSRQPPKKTLKQLGYRSLASFLKHETPVSMLTAAWLIEGNQWRQHWLNQYKQLRPSDFESRPISVTPAGFKRWQTIAGQAASDSKHNVLAFKELGALVLLPLPSDAPAGSVTASLSLALHELNEIRAGSSFLKLNQVRPDFGQLVREVAADQPRLAVRLLDQPVSWSLLQQYYSRLGHELHAVFEPHVQLEDLAWQPIEAALQSIEPGLSFWQHSDHLAVLHDHRPVSLNVVDAALNLCNQLPFEQRISHYFQRSLWHELLLRYVEHEPVEQTVLAGLEPQLATETIIA